MRAIRVREFGGPGVLRVEEVEDPRPGPGEVVVRVRAAGVNPVETYIRSGTYPRRQPLPFTPGTDAAGEVEAAGAGVEGLAPGDRVYTAGTLSGAYAERALCRADQVHPLPASVAFAEGAGVHVPCATAWRALFHKARAERGEVVLVHGATGAVGLAAVQMARAAGMTVVGTGGTEEGRALAKSQGADFVLDHSAKGYLDALPGLLGGRGPTVILEMLANRNLAEDLRVLGKGGRVVVIGSRGTLEIDPRAAMGGDLSILGMSLWNVPPDEMAAIHAELGKGLASGVIRPVIDREFPLDGAAAAHEAVMAPGSRGKIVLIP